MAEYWSRAPFISHDGIDSAGVRAEVKVSLGFGIPKTIKPSDKGIAAQVTFPVDNTKWPSSGWAPIDSDLMKVVQEAHDKDEPLHFRIETIRKPNVDRTLPITELTAGSDAARENANKSLAAVKRENDDEWTISPRAMTRLEEDPAPGGGNSAYAHSLEDLQAAAGKQSTAAPAVATAEPVVNEDGEANFASDKTLVVARIFAKLSANAKENGLSIDSDTNRKLSRALAAGAGKLQVQTSRGALEAPSVSLPSYENAVEAVLLTVESMSPLTAEALGDGGSEWVKGVLKSALAFWTWSANEVARRA